ncbi:MAG: hypothetical protein RLZZ42_690 [Bacteroidota bacterium]|jgi:hypothetical protein
MDDQLKTIIASSREQLDKAVPDPALFILLMEKLEVRKLKKRRLHFLKVASLSGIAAVLLIGSFVLFFTEQSNSRIQVKVSRSKPEQIAQAETVEKHSHAHEESLKPDNLKEARVRKSNLLVQSGQQLLFQFSSSPSKRITSIYATEKQKRLEREMIDALFEVLNNDPNTNVRMAALDVLTAHINDAMIRKRLVYAMVQQDEPMVQLLMIQMLSGSGEKDYIDKLRQILHDPKTDEEVREEARFSFAQQAISLN